jgi:hypothetical protein
VRIQDFQIQKRVFALAIRPAADVVQSVGHSATAV